MASPRLAEHPLISNLFDNGRKALESRSGRVSAECHAGDVVAEYTGRVRLRHARLIELAANRVAETMEAHASTFQTESDQTLAEQLAKPRADLSAFARTPHKAREQRTALRQSRDVFQ